MVKQTIYLFVILILDLAWYPSLAKREETIQNTEYCYDPVDFLEYIFEE